MANFNLTITNEGAAFLANVIANQGSLDFTEVRFSSTNYVGSEATLTEGTFGGTFITAVPSASVADLTTINVESSFDNSSFTTDKTLYSIGVIAEDGDGNVALVAVCTTSTPDTIPKFVSVASTFTYNINLTVSDTQNITVTASGAGVVFVTDIVNDLTSENTNKPLSAKQGKVLKDMIAHRNLIMNPWFTVNQRGALSYSSVAYTVDRWRLFDSFASVTVSSNGITLTHNSSTSTSNFGQYFEDGSVDYLVGKTVTLSVLLQDGTLYSKTDIASSSSPIVVVVENYTFEFLARTSAPFVRFGSDVSNATLAIRAVKLEIGSVSTLHLDTAPDYSTELLKCQRYYYQVTALENNAYFSVGTLETATNFFGAFRLPTKMRVTPTASYSGTIKVYCAGNLTDISNLGLMVRIDDNIFLNINSSSAMGAAGQSAALLMATAGDKIIFNAEL